MEERIYSDEDILAYLDGKLNPEAQIEFENAVSKSSTLEERVQWLQSVNKLMLDSSLETAPQGFSKNVMQALDEKATRRFPRNGLILLLGVLVALTFITLLLSGSNLDLSVFNQLIPQNISLGDTRVDLPTVTPVNTKLIINGVLFANLFLALLLMERVILRPYFRGRVGY